MDGNDSKNFKIVRVAVGSGNPSKIKSVKDAMWRVMKQKNYNEQKDEISLEVEGFDVESGVAAQPMGDEETQAGARNRAVAAYKGFEMKYRTRPDLAVGLEGGLEYSSDGKMLWCMAWMCCYGKRTEELLDLLSSSDVNVHGDGELIFGLAKTASFEIPPPITALVKKGLELGDADDKVFNRINAKQGSGTVGILSNYIIDRSAYYEHALILALIPWIRADVYPHGCASLTQESGQNIT